MIFNPPVPLKWFCAEESARQGVALNTIYYRISKGFYFMRYRRKNKRVVFVVEAKCRATRTVNFALGEELSMKEFVDLEASRLGMSTSAVAMRLCRGKYNGLISIRRANKRVVFVKPLLK